MDPAPGKGEPLEVDDDRVERCGIAGRSSESMIKTYFLSIIEKKVFNLLLYYKLFTMLTRSNCVFVTLINLPLM